METTRGEDLLVFFAAFCFAGDDDGVLFSTGLFFGAALVSLDDFGLPGFLFVGSGDGGDTMMVGCTGEVADTVILDGLDVGVEGGDTGFLFLEKAAWPAFFLGTFLLGPGFAVTVFLLLVGAGDVTLGEGLEIEEFGESIMGEGGRGGGELGVGTLLSSYLVSIKYQ